MENRAVRASVLCVGISVIGLFTLFVAIISPYFFSHNRALAQNNQPAALYFQDSQMPGLAPVKEPDALADIDRVDDELAVKAAAVLTHTPTLADLGVLSATVLAESGPVVKIIVTQAGINVVSGSALIQSGIPTGTAVSHIQMTQGGVEVPLEVWDTGAIGQLDASDSFRFYVDHGQHSMTVGNYWVEEQVYWISVDEVDGLRMMQRDVLPTADTDALTRTIAFEEGIWEDNRLYESTMEGIDGDNWFHAEMEVEPSQSDDPSTYPSLTITLNHTLTPTASDLASEFSLTGSSDSVASHSLQVDLGTTETSVAWTNLQYYASFSHTIISTVSHPISITLTSQPGSFTSDIRIDKLYWKQPVALDFGGKGASFSGVEGTWRYLLTNVSTDSALYDVTDPMQPQRLLLPEGADPKFEDGPEARSYILATSGDVGLPTVEPYQPIEFDTSFGADAIYIAPQQFMEGLVRLVHHRQGQGYKVAVIDVQDIYDAWGDGIVDPVAIRRFLQFAHENWQPAPTSVVLVGDSTIDPKNYMGRQNGYHNFNFMPTYLEPIDPWLGDTACDSCFVQLDDEHPLAGITDKDFLIDMWLGRFSVQNHEHLFNVVNKIVAYETAPEPTDDEKSVAVFITDNYIRHDDTLDSAGNFAKSTDEIIEEYLSSNVRAERLYYIEQSEVYSRPIELAQEWVESEPDVARERVFELLDSGPALVSFVGHSNHFQMGRTEVDNGYIVGFNDLLRLSPQDKPFILFPQTSYTSQFQYVSTTGTTIDERAMRLPGSGAVAVWGPAGLSVMTGHPFMAKGFHELLAKESNQPMRMGELIEAGYFFLFENQNCCQDVRKTYMLQGDPLTPARIGRPTIPSVEPLPVITPTHDLTMTTELTPEVPTIRSAIVSTGTPTVTVELSGTTISNADVVLLLDGDILTMTAPAPEGIWNVTLQLDMPGEHEIQVAQALGMSDHVDRLLSRPIVIDIPNPEDDTPTAEENTPPGEESEPTDGDNRDFIYLPFVSPE